MGECAPAAAAVAPTTMTTKTSVWWDIDKCAVPRGRCDPHRIAHNVIAALAAAGYGGPVSIAAYGDAARVPLPVLAALSATGICLNHVPAGSKDTSEKRMLVDMLFWAFDNPPPGNYLVISGDQDLSDLLHRLRMKRYDILLVRPPNASSLALSAAAKKVWLWENLTAGDVLLPEPPPATSMLGCKLIVNSPDTSKVSQSKVCFEYGKDDANGRSVTQNRVKPLQKYVKKTSSSSIPGINQDGAAMPASEVSQSSAGTTLSQLDHSSVSLFSSNSHSLEGAKVDTSVPSETPTLSKLSFHKPVLSTYSHQVEATHKSILGERPRTWAESVQIQGASNSRYNQTSQHLRHSEAHNPEFAIGGNKGKAVNLHRVKPLQKYVKKANITLSSACSSVRDSDHPIGSGTIELDQAAHSSASTSKSREPKFGSSGRLETSALSQSSAQNPIASARLYQVRAPRESILGKKPSASVEHASRNGTHDFDACTIPYHPAYQQYQSSEALNKLHAYSNMDHSGVKLGNEHKLNQHQAYVKRINVSSALSSIEIDQVNVNLDNSKGSTFSHLNPCASASSSSKALENTKGNESGLLLSTQKHVMTDNLCQDGAAFAFDKKASTSFECTTRNGTFVFGASSGHYDPTSHQAQSTSPLERHNSSSDSHRGCGPFHSISSHRGSSALLSAGHSGVSSGVSSAQIQTCTSGSTFESLADICYGFSRLNISEYPRATSETKPPFQVVATDDPSMGMAYVSGNPSGLHKTTFSNPSSDHQSGYALSSDSCRAVHPPNLSSDVQCSGHPGEKPGYPQNSSDPEGAIGIILRALGVLKTEKMFPTESNIADCIKYGEINLTDFDAKKALELAIRHEAVIMKKLLNDMPLFVAKDESLWKCVNVTNTKAKNPIEELDAVQKYISSTSGYSAIKNSQSRFQAAMILKRSCLQNHCLGDILQVLHIVIVRKKWIVPHSKGWQPLSLNTPVVITATDDTGKARS